MASMGYTGELFADTLSESNPIAAFGEYQLFGGSALSAMLSASETSIKTLVED